MSRRLLRSILAVVLLSTWMIGGIAFSLPAHGTAESGDFSAASRVLSQSGIVGKYELFEPPSSPALQCNYPTGFFQASMAFQRVKVYPADGLDTQHADITYSLKRRLPDGSLQTVHDWKVISWTATTQTPLDTGSIGQVESFDPGSTFVQSIKIDWYFGLTVSGHVELLVTKYQTTIFGSQNQVLPVTDACYPVLPTSITCNRTTAIVGQGLGCSIERFPEDPTYSVGVYLDGKRIDSIATNLYGHGEWAKHVPAMPMGKHTVKFYRYGRSASWTFTVKPRVTVIPRYNLLRGQTVNVSLRGYAAHETVNVRWIKNGSFVHLAYVTTSSTGSANIDVKVPTWVPDGSTSVRGDGAYGHAQTNEVKVSGGTPLSSASVKVSTTATATPAASPHPAPPEPTTTVVSTEQPATREAMATATVQPTDTATPADTETPTVQPTETPTIEPTAIPSETPFTDPTAVPTGAQAA